MTLISVHEAAYRALMADSFDAKRDAVSALSRQWSAGALTLGEAAAVETIADPGRPLQPQLVHPRDLKARKLHTAEGHAAFIHALAHIEFNAINLALDAIYRFRDMPADYYGDWISVAVEEAYHHDLLAEHLQTLGFRYGDFPAHSGLWDMALRTDADLLLRMALVPRVFEARGLDVTPPMIERLKQHGDTRGAEILGIILGDEVGHVAIGNRWYHWACEKRGVDPAKTFVDLINEYLPGRVKGPFHLAARLEAGFTEQELQQLENL
jgi:uncharacterized ferritin-like protein (DUF455 family)